MRDIHLGYPYIGIQLSLDSIYERRDWVKEGAVSSCAPSGYTPDIRVQSMYVTYTRLCEWKIRKKIGGLESKNYERKSALATYAPSPSLQGSASRPGSDTGSLSASHPRVYQLSASGARKGDPEASGKNFMQ
eukprot:173495-Amorphochlora_amoeboformis.AAC.2